MNVFIVEDEKHTADLLIEVIEQDSDFLVTKVASSITEAVHYLGKHQRKLDLLFLDIHLADGHSFEIFKHIDIYIPVIFCTAYDEYSLQAIKNNGINYILKPFKEEDIHDALTRFKKLVGTIQDKNLQILANTTIPTTTYQESFLAQLREKSIVIYTDDIAIFTIENETVYLHTFQGKRYPLFKNLEYIESVCSPNQFFRVNRQMLVNRKAVISIESYFGRKLAVSLNIKLPNTVVVSRLKVSDFKAWLEKGNSHEV